MFIAHKDNVIPSFWEDSLNFSGVELTSFSPWFMCQVPHYDEGSVVAAYRSTHLIGDVISLYHFSKTHDIEITYILAPAHMTKTQYWSMRRLRSVSKAIYKIDDYQNLVYRFETENGILDYDIGGLAKGSIDLKFEPIVVCNLT